ncbi:hypothetical protein V5F44_09700 [Xanthobacter sp. V2C-8]|uniref:hypothetical protein n=1 Tax=Xanthobacter albus TaxID=3119929 RepID=UPI0037287FDD
MLTFYMLGACGAEEGVRVVSGSMAVLPSGDNRAPPKTGAGKMRQMEKSDELE